MIMHFELSKKGIFPYINTKQNVNCKRSEKVCLIMMYLGLF